MIRLLAVLLLAAGCGAPAVTCENTGFKSVWSEDLGLDCQAFRAIATTSREILLAAGVMNDVEINYERGTTDVHVVATEDFDAPFVGRHLFGASRWGQGITLGAHLSMQALIHEEIHGLEMDHWVGDTQWHGQWEVRGYWGVADFGEWYMGGLPRFCNRKRAMTEEQRIGLRVAGWPLAQYDNEPCQ